MSLLMVDVCRCPSSLPVTTSFIVKPIAIALREPICSQISISPPVAALSHYMFSCWEAKFSEQLRIV
eukprot:6213222-Pleurochrysis_carterae.AAC.6